MACGHHNRLWYHHPHLQPPRQQPTLEPPNDNDPGHHPADDPPGADPPGADPPLAPPPAGAGITDDPTHCPRCAPTTPSRGPDLALTDSDTTYQIWLAA
jgi:hypothetical protein